MVNLSGAGVGVLPPWVQVLARPALLVEPDDDLLACLLLRRDVPGGEVVDAVLPSPGEGVEEALLGFLDGPVGGAEVAEDAFTGEPSSLVFGDGAGLVLLVFVLVGGGAFYVGEGLGLL